MSIGHFHAAFNTQASPLDNRECQSSYALHYGICMVLYKCIKSLLTTHSQSCRTFVAVSNSTGNNIQLRSTKKSKKMNTSNIFHLG